MECNHNCATCNLSCDKKSLLTKPNPLSSVKKLIGVVSGKGGVGKSLVTSMLAVTMAKKGYKTAVLDADITGASIAKIFGIKEKATGDDKGIYPAMGRAGIKLMSSNLLLANDTDPVIWRGPIIAGLVKQFWSDVIWSDVDYMFVDMPPGTGDVPLTVFQSLPLDGIILVSTPQELVGMIVEKALNMAKKMNIRVLGIIENMSYVECPACHEKISLFGEKSLAEDVFKHNLQVLGRIPLSSSFSKLCDEGRIEDVNTGYIEDAASLLETLPFKYDTYASFTDGKEIIGDVDFINKIEICKVAKDMVISHCIINVKEDDDILKILLKNKVEYLLCDKLNRYLQDLFLENNIKVLPGNKGRPLDALRLFLSGVGEDER